MILSWIDSLDFILQSSIIIEFSISQFCRIVLSPTLTYGPSLTAGPIVQFLPIITGPTTTESWDIVEFFPITILFLILASISIKNWFSVPIESRTSLFAWIISSGVPVSFHQPVTVSYSILFPWFINISSASVTSSSPRKDGFRLSMISNIFGVRK